MSDEAAADLVKTNAPSVPAALKALADMRSELTSGKTYAEIRKIEAKAQVILKMFRDKVEEVEGEAEITITCCQTRIGEELKRIPKQSGGDRKSKKSKAAPKQDLISQKEGTGIDSGTRSRFGKLADL